MENIETTINTLTKDHEEMLDELSRLLRVMRRGPRNSQEALLAAADGGRGPHQNHLVHGQGKLLHILHHHGEMCSGELAQRMDIRPSSLTEKLARLEEAGLVTRRPDPDDSRRTLVALGSAGLKFSESETQRRNPGEQEMARALTPEEAATFAALCKKISDHMEALPSFCHHRPGDEEPGPHRHCRPDGGRRDRGCDSEERKGPGEPKNGDRPEERKGPQGPKNMEGRERL